MADLQVLVENFTVISFGLMAGIYFVFSNTIMKALSNVEENQAAQTMSQINSCILNPIFFLLFWGSAAGSCIVVFLSFHNDFSLAVLVGAVIFLIGSTVVTLVVNVPLNNRLQTAVLNSVSMLDVWPKYMNSWNSWNNVRTVSSGLAFILLVISI